MERKEVHYQGLALEYREKGENPSWLIYSGTHGDEAGVISSIETVLSSEEKNFPSFLWVPMVSPSAVANGTRNNARGVNVNRDFFDHSTEPEVQANISLIRGKVFEYFIDIHEDPSTELFYLYDSWNIPDNPMMQHLFRTIQNTGVGLYDGIDDPDDSFLGYPVRNGYVSMADDETYRMQETGSTTSYLAYHGMVTKRLVTLEIPGKVSQEKKDAIVAACFDYFLTIR